MANITPDSGLVTALTQRNVEVVDVPVQVEVENTADDEYLLAPAQDWFEDIMEQCVPGSVVILIVLVLCANPIFKTLNNWIKRNK